MIHICIRPLWQLERLPGRPDQETEKTMNRVYKKSVMYAVCAALLFAFLAVFTNVKPVHAAGSNAKNYLGKAIYTESADSEQATWFSGGVGLNYSDGTSSVITCPIDESEISGSGYLFGFIDAGGNVYNMEFAYTDSDIGYTEWVLEGRGNDSYFLSTFTSAYKGDEYSFAYFNSGDQKAVTTGVTFNDCTDHGFLTADSVPNDILTHPGVVVSEDNDLIALFTKNEIFMSVGTNPSSFTGGDSGSDGGSSGGSSSGGTSGGSSENSPEIHEVPTDLDFTDDEKNQVGNGTEATGVEDGGVNGKETASLSGAKTFPVIPVVIGVLIVAALAGAAVFFTKKKKPARAAGNADTGMSQQGGYGSGSGNSQEYGADMLDKTVDLRAQQRPSQRPPVQQNVQGSPARQVGVVALDGGLRGRGFRISGTGVTIGRDPSCEAAFPQGSEGSHRVSRRHCKLFFENGRLLLVDLGSTNGTYMADGRRLTPMQPVAVKPGDRFYLDNPGNMFEIRM